MITHRTGYLKCLGALALTAVLVALLLWIKGVYRSSLNSYLQIADKCLSLAAEEELRIRIFSLGGKFKTWLVPSSDTSTYVTKTIQFEDTVFYVRVSRKDPTAVSKIRQFYFFRADYPLDTGNVDSLFKCNMVGESLPLKASYVEFLDVKKDSVMASSPHESNVSKYIATSTDTLDIFKTIGIKAHVKVPARAVLHPVMQQLWLPGCLIFVVIICILKLLVDIVRWRREEFMLLYAVSERAEQSMNQAADRLQGVSKKLRIKKLDEESDRLDTVREGLLVDSGYFERLRAILHNEEGKISFNKKPLNVKVVLEKWIEPFEKIIYKNVIISVEVLGDIFICTDETWFKRIFEELLDNCVKYSNDPVRVIIKAVSEEQQAIIVICSIGWGISQADLEHLFIIHHDIAKLYKDASEPGTKPGLGLSFAVSFMRALGGSVKVFSQDECTGVKLVFRHTKDDMQAVAKVKRKEQKYNPK